MRTPPKYQDILLGELKTISQDLKEVSSTVNKQSVEIATVKVELSRNNEHMAEYNDQLKIHIKNSELAHKRADDHDRRIFTMESEVKDVQLELTNKLDLVYKHIEEERYEKTLRKEIEAESQIKKERLYKTFRLVAMISGVPMALYGLLKFVLEIASKLGPLVP